MPQPLRFVHASDLHLERPLEGGAELSDRLVDLAIDAPYAAARRIFDLAERERADFLILSGDVVDVDRAGPRALAFLLEQFSRLAEQGISVYWVEGRAEQHSPWPDDLPLPANVHRFARGTAQRLVHSADDDPLAAIVGTSSHGTEGSLPSKLFAHPLSDDAKNAKRGLFTIGVAYAPRFGDSRMWKCGVDYWALGGRHLRKRVLGGGVKSSGPVATALFPGTPQGRTQRVTGSQGAAVVQVDEHSVARARFVAVDVVRWRRLVVRCESGLSALSIPAVRALLSQRIEAEIARAPGVDLFLDWTLVTPHGGRRDAAPGQELLRWLRAEYGSHAPLAWSVGLKVRSMNDEPTATSNQVPADGSLLGDFLSEVTQFAAGAAAVPLAELLPAGVDEGLARLLCTSDRQSRDVLVRRAAALGRELLGAEEAAE